MKFVALFLLFALNAIGQNANWAWAQNPGTPSDERVLATCANGNLGTYSTGFFRGSNITFGTNVLNSQGNQDFFLVKYDASGTVLWAKGAGGTSSDGGISLEVDARGNIYVLGYFQSTSFAIGGHTVNNSDTTGNFSAYFLLKCDSFGSVVWLRSPGGFFLNGVVGQGGSLKLDSSGNIIVAGQFTSRTMMLDTFTLTNTDTTYTPDIFFGKYDTNGTVIWAAKAGGKGTDLIEDIAVSPSGNVYGIGETTSQNMKFGNITLPTTFGQQDFFVARYDSTGGIIWAKRVGGNQNDWGRSITWQERNVYIESSFQSSSVNAMGIIVNRIGVSDLLFAKIDEMGNALWAKSLAGNFSASRITIDSSETLYATGEYYNKYVNLGSNTLVNADTVNGTADIFIIKIDTSGAIKWATGVGGATDDISRSIISIAGSVIYVSGWFSSPSISFGTNLLNNNGLIDLFLSKLDNSTDERYILSGRNYCRIFPNPANNYSTITSWDTQIKKVQIWDAKGELLYQSEIEGSGNINLSSFNSGLYQVRVFDNKGLGTAKFVIQKD